MVLGPTALKTLKPLDVEDHAVGSPVQILALIFIGPLIDQFIQGDFGISWWADEIDRDLLTLF